MKTFRKLTLVLILGAVFGASNIGFAANTPSKNNAAQQAMGQAIVEWSISGKGAAESKKISPSDRVSAAEIVKSLPSFLFVIDAQKASLQQLKGETGMYLLTLKYADVNNVIAFSDRPYRLVNYMSAQQFQIMWGTGGSFSYQDDPPNAVLISNNQAAQIVVLQTITVLNDSKISFKLHLTNPANGTLSATSLKNVTLVID